MYLGLVTFLIIKIEFNPVFLTSEVVNFEVSHPDTSLIGQGITSVEFSLGKLSEAQGTHLNLGRKRSCKPRELENDEDVSLEAIV